MTRCFDKFRIAATGHLIAFLALCLAFDGLAGNAKAQEPLVLREQIEVASDLVTLGDLFDNAGSGKSIAVFRSPELGTSGVVAAVRVAAAAQRHGLEWTNPGAVRQVTVERPGRLVTLDEVREAINTRIGDGGYGEDSTTHWSVTFSRGMRQYYIDHRVSSPITVKQFDLQQSSGAFRAVITVDGASFPVKDKVFTGRAYPSVEAIVPARVIERGTTITRDDVQTVTMPRSRVSNSAIEDMETAIGMAARQRLIVGRPIRRGDLEHPKLVKRNSLVTITYSIPGMELKAKGRALADAAKGQTVQIVNLQSKRTIEAQVTGTATVSVALNQPTRPAPARRRSVSQNQRGQAQNSFVIR